jgi:hypothetical protein
MRIFHGTGVKFSATVRLFSSVLDTDPFVFRPTGSASGSVSYTYGSGSLIIKHIFTILKLLNFIS